jgi:isocitrate dehydrogenase (NAD+)
LIPGDGIGPEIAEAVQIVLDAPGSPVVWDVRQAGMAAIEKLGDPLPAETLRAAACEAGSEGPLTTPIGGGFRSASVRLREEFGLYAKVRPVRTLISRRRYENIDLVALRENLESLYVGYLEMLWSSANTAKKYRVPYYLRNEYLLVTAPRV